MARLREFDEDKVIDAVVDCFWARGYEATSVRELADCMGISGASLYNAFGDKRALFVTALERYCTGRMRERTSGSSAITLPSRADAAFLAEIIERSLADRDRKGCLLVNSALDVAPHDAALAAVAAGCISVSCVPSSGATSWRLAWPARRRPIWMPTKPSGHFLGVL